MVPFACIHCRTKRIKTNSTIEKGGKAEKKKGFSGDLRGPPAGEPYGPPSPLAAILNFSTIDSEGIIMMENKIKINKIKIKK
jgi:hypothetical protein